MQRKTGILLVNLGTPDNPYKPAVRTYLNEFLTDGRVIDYPWLSRQLLVRGIIIPFRVANSSKTYQEIWDKEKGSPLLMHTTQLAEAVRTLLDKEETPAQKYILEMAMRYQHPSIEKALENLKQQHLHEIIVFPLFQQYASASTGSVQEKVMSIVSKWLYIPDMRFISSYHNRPEMIKVFADHARRYDMNSYDHFIFSFHGLPQRQLRNSGHAGYCLSKPGCCEVYTQANHSCYSAQCYNTARLIAEELHLARDKYTITFQSRLGKEPWAEPYTSETLKSYAQKGMKRILVFCPAFTADCLETIYEMVIENNEIFKEAGGEHLDLVESLNSDPAWAACVKQMILENVRK